MSKRQSTLFNYFTSPKVSKKESNGVPKEKGKFFLVSIPIQSSQCLVRMLKHVL